MSRTNDFSYSEQYKKHRKFAFVYSFLEVYLKSGYLSKESYDKIMSILVKEDNNGI